MADTKISALTAATTPLAGTEVLPIVQSSATKQVSIANVTAGRAVSGASFAVTGSSAPANGIYLSATNTVSIATNSAEKVQVNSSGQVGVGVTPYASVGGNGELLQIGDPLTKAGSGLTIGATTTGDIQYSNAASGTGQYAGLLRYSFGTNTFAVWTNSASRVTVGSGGDTTLVTGNLIQGTAAKGVNFTANTGAAGMTSQLLNWYEEGTWTPTDASGAALTFSSASGFYTRIGRLVNWQAVVVYPSTANGSDSLIGGLPFTIAGGSGSQGRAGSFITLTDVAVLTHSLQMDGTTTIRPYKAGFVRATNANLSGGTLYIGGFYVV